MSMSMITEFLAHGPHTLRVSHLLDDAAQAVEFHLKEWCTLTVARSVEALVIEQWSAPVPRLRIAWTCFPDDLPPTAMETIHNQIVQSVWNSEGEAMSALEIKSRAPFENELNHGGVPYRYCVFDGSFCPTGLLDSYLLDELDSMNLDR